MERSIDRLLTMQKELDLKTKRKRVSGFKPRKRDNIDLIMALDDEFNEFMKELPDDVNFKTWKEKEHNPRKQLLEYADCLFFLLASINEFHNRKSWLKERIERGFDRMSPNRRKLVKCDLVQFKYAIAVSNLEKEFDVVALFDYYFSVGEAVGYDKDILIDAYCEKWNINMGRDKTDWTLGGK